MGNLDATKYDVKYLEIAAKYPCGPKAAFFAFLELVCWVHFPLDGSLESLWSSVRVKVLERDLVVSDDSRKTESVCCRFAS